MGDDLAILNGGWNNVFSEVHQIVIQARYESFAIEDINAHRGLEKFFGCRMPNLAQQVARNSQRIDNSGIFGFLHKSSNPALAVGCHDAESGNSFALDWDRSYREIGTSINMLADHLTIIHPVELVSAEDDKIFATMLQKVSHVLADRIGCALIPLRALGGLLSGQNFDETWGEIVELIALVDMGVQRGAVELSKNVNATQSRVQAIADWNIDQSVFAAKWYGWLGAFLGKRKQPRSRAAAHNNSERLRLEGGGRLYSHITSELAPEALCCHVGFMCGIVAYIGASDALPVLLDGLRRLEYRGYDSAGVAVFQNDRIEVRKTVGRIANLVDEVERNPVSGHAGISHTRWATHGAVTRENAHPHTDRSGRLHLVHNGVIENYQTLREQLIERGHNFHSQTDTEVLAHLVGEAFEKSPSHDKGALVDAVRSALRQVIGTYGVSVVHSDVPGVIVGARRGSPLVLGIGKNEHFLASDVSAIVAHTRDVVYLNDYEIVCLQADGFEISTVSGGGAGFQISKVEFDASSVDKGKYPHYMLKEIHEQPNSVRDAMRGRLSLEEATAKLGGLNMTNAELRAVDRIVLVGCGTAFHAAMAGEYLIESLSHIPVECEFASEFRYRNIPLQRDTLAFVISQSGETADTLAALRESQRKGHRTLGICNNVASTIARESDGGVYMHAGPEIGVAATKSFTSQLTIFTLLGLLLGRIRHLSHSEGRDMISQMEKLPDLVARTIELESQVAAIAKKYAHSKNFLFLGRQAHYPIALEGALKLKEISYISASGYPSAELKHGVIALITEETPSLFIAPQDAVFEKNISNIEEVKARKGPVIAIGTEGDHALKKICDDVVLIPEAPPYLTPILSVIPLQLLAYHIAVELGCDVDKPRNLAKSVTVE